MGTRLRIGEFARIAKVTIRTLRHYEDEELLRPVYIRNNSRYRYYDTAQLLTVHRIGALRDIGMSIAAIRRVLRSNDNGAQLLRAQRALLENAIAREITRLRRLDAMLRGGADSPDQRPVCARVRSIPPTIALCRRATVPHLGKAVSELFESAESAARNDRIDESPFLLLHGDRQSAGGIDVEVCIPVDARSRLPGVREVEGTAIAGCLVYQGEYSQAESLFDAMHRWIGQIGARAGGPPREVYHRFGADERGYRLPGHRLTNQSTDYVTELQMPVVPDSR
jgi:DNA-binding transcriptional MerR regulator